jgi:sugar-specific transcriptional regulator TrmB
MVYEFLQKGSAKRADIESAVGFKEDKIRGVLQQLIDRGLVEKHDNGKNTYYKAVTRT